MFAKLLKHEFRAVKKALLPLIIAALLTSVLGYVIMLFAESELSYNIDSPILNVLSIFRTLQTPVLRQIPQPPDFYNIPLVYLDYYSTRAEFCQGVLQSSC